MCYREARGSKPDPAKMSPLLASLSWQLLGAPPKAGSGKHKGSLCKTFSKKKKKGKNKCKCFPQPQRGGGQDTEQTPGRPGPYEGPLQRSFEPNWPVPEESEGEQEGESDAMAQFHAISCRAALGEAPVWCLLCLLLRQKLRGKGGPHPFTSHPIAHTTFP